MMDGGFTAAYFDHNGLYAYGRQPNAVAHNVHRLGECLQLIDPTLEMKSLFDAFAQTVNQTHVNHVLWRLGLEKTQPEKDAALAQSMIEFLAKGSVNYTTFFHDLFAGGDAPERARQGPPRQSRLSAKGTPAANLLGCLREQHSTDERRYYGMLYNFIVGGFRAPCSETTRLLSEVWSSVSTTLRAELEGAGATPPVTPGAGASVPGAGRELGAHAAALRAIAPAASIPGRATPKTARAPAPGVGLRGHMSAGRARLVEATPARCGKKRRTTREP